MSAQANVPAFFIFGKSTCWNFGDVLELIRQCSIDVVICEYVEYNQDDAANTCWYHVLCANEEVAGIVASSGLAECRIEDYEEGIPMFIWQEDLDSLLWQLHTVAKEQDQVVFL